MDAPSLNNICDPDFDERGPLLGKVVKLDKTMGDVDGRRRTIIKIELVPFSVDEDPKSFTNVYQLRALDHLASSAASQHAIMISQQLDQGDNNSPEPSGLNATVDEVAATTLLTDLEEGDPSIYPESVSSAEGAVRSPPSSPLDEPPQRETQPLSSFVPHRDEDGALSQPALPLQQPSFPAQPEVGTPKPSTPSRRPRTPYMGKKLLPPSPPFLQLSTDSPPSRQLTFPPNVEESPPSSAPIGQPPSPALVQREMSQLRTHPPSPTVRESPSPLPSVTLQQPSLSEEETPPSRAPTPPITVRDSLPQLPCQQSSALSQKITLLLQYPTPPPDREEMSYPSPQQRRTPTFTEGEKSVYFPSTGGEDPLLRHFSPQGGHAPDLAGGDTSPLFSMPDDGAWLPSQLHLAPVEPPTPIPSGSRSQSPPHLPALPSVEATSATSPSQNYARSTRSSTSKNTPQERALSPHGFEDTASMKQTRQTKSSNKRKRGISEDKETVEPEKRVRPKRNGANSVTGRKESTQGLDVTLDKLAKQFSTAIRLGGQVSLEPGGRTLPIHLTAPTRSHSTTFQALLMEQEAHAGALTSRATIANMTYSWCLLGEIYRSRVIGSNRDYRKEARLRRSGLWVISIVNRVYHGLRTRMPDQGTGDGAFDAYKIPAALAAASRAELDDMPAPYSYRDYSPQRRDKVAELIAQDLMQNEDKSWRAIGPEFALDPAAEITTSDFSYEEARIALGLEAEPLYPRFTENADEELNTNETEGTTGMMDTRETTTINNPWNSWSHAFGSAPTEGATATIETADATEAAPLSGYFKFFDCGGGTELLNLSPSPPDTRSSG